MKDKKILLVADYHRKNIRDMFKKISNNATIYYIYQSERKGSDLTFDEKILYWSDFMTPYQILKTIKPDSVIFCNIESFYEISLNLAAMNLGINTYNIDHGFSTSLMFKVRKQLDGDFYQRKLTSLFSFSILKKLKTLFFYISALRMKNKKFLIPYFKLLYYRYKYGVGKGLEKAKGNFRQAQRYICFSDMNKSYWDIRDDICDEKFSIVGFPEFDNFFGNKVKIDDGNQKYYLLIDTPLLEHPHFGIKDQDVLKFYQKLNCFCLENNSKLYIKLHPISYFRDTSKTNENIKFIREASSCEIANLIYGAKGCFSFVSTLLVPMVLMNHVIVFRLWESDLIDDIIKLGLGKCLEFKSFGINEIEFSEDTHEEEYQKIYIDKYLHRIDGKAVSRIAKILQL